MGEKFSRRSWLGWTGAGLAGWALGRKANAESKAQAGKAAAKPASTAVQAQSTEVLPPYTGPQQLPYWNSVGPYVHYPQKSPLIRLTDRPVQLETPRHFFVEAFTPNHAFFVRWHLDDHPTRVDLTQWRLRIHGEVKQAQALSLQDLMTKFTPVTVAAVNQCSGNSRALAQPRVPGGQWGHGAMGCARWTGVKVTDLLNAAGLKKSALQVQFEALDLGKGPQGSGAHRYLKSLALDDKALADTILAYSMNGEPLPMLNGFPLRVVVPGYYSTYWVKSLSGLHVLSKPDDNFWMKKAYHIPDNPRANTTPEAMATGKVKKVPISKMLVRSFLVTPDGNSKIPAGLPVTVRGIAFSGHGQGGVKQVEFSDDNGKTWRKATLGEDHGPYAFRTWSIVWQPKRSGNYTLAVRATDGKGDVQPDSDSWNPGGYMRNRIERETIVVGEAG